MPNGPYHRLILKHNHDELLKVEETMEIWGKEAKTSATGMCVQAYPSWHSVAYAYSFGTPVKPVEKFGFRDKIMVLRELQWPEGLHGVEDRENGKYVCIRVSWLEKEMQIQ